ncbi:TPA: flavin-containing monooxygenase [Acinetobacter baumannii]
MKELDAIIIGAGFSGLYMLHKLRKLGLNVKVVERGEDIGGTWFWNRYPGARCDIDSIFYSYTFSEEIYKEWNWSSRYAEQPEILEYINYVADKLDLKKDILLNHNVENAVYDENKSKWKVNLNNKIECECKFLIAATGALSNASIPKLEGLENFKGEYYHTGNWPKEGVNFKGKKVGILGTGSTGIQVIPRVAKEAEELYVFQRTAQYTTPANNFELTKEYIDDIKTNFNSLCDKRENSFNGTDLENITFSFYSDTPKKRLERLEEAWSKGGLYFAFTYKELLVDSKVSLEIGEFIKTKIESIVESDNKIQLLKPNYYFGARRPILDSGYYETFNRENVHLVDIKSNPIKCINDVGISLKENDYPLDIIILATGYDAVTGALFGINPKGKNGISLKDHWQDGAFVKTYLGLMCNNFPNLFIVTGPESPSVLSNMVASIEQHVEWISDFIEYIEKNNIVEVEPTEEEENKWHETVKEMAKDTLFNKVDSWYTAANIPGKKRPDGFLMYVGGLNNYRKICKDIANQGYIGFNLKKIQTSNIKEAV